MSKSILITGKNSYIGTKVKEYILDNTDWKVQCISVRGDEWKNIDFSIFDSVLHVAGIAHSDVGKVSENQKQMYYKVNTELTIEVAKKSKNDGVKQFIFMSSAIVYGDSAPIGKTKIITKDTKVSPSNFYGDSKVKAEEGIKLLDSPIFKVVIIRPPMIYGKGSKGNYPLLAKYANRFALFPLVHNERSVLFIENLCEFIKLLVANDEQGVFHPQNSEYINTSSLVKMIAATHNKKIHYIHCVTWVLKVLSHFTGIINKAFGSLTYDRCLSDYKVNYQIIDFEESIKRTENPNG